MFQHGFSQIAKDKWLEIIHKNVDNRGFFEWDNKEGIGLGSDFFAGTAGSMGKALFEGYFGIKLAWDSLSIEPKLGRESGQVYLFQPATDRYVEYIYEFDENTNTITLTFDSNFPSPGTLKILNPWFSSTETGGGSDRIEVTLDGEAVRFKRERINEDEFLVFRTDLFQHIVEIAMKNDRPPTRTRQTD
jgi:hypothetical protein